MDTNSGRIYQEEGEIKAAEARGEQLVYGKLAALEDIQPLVLNRAARREQARRRARESRRAARGR